MIKENAKLIHNLVIESAKKIEGKLPDHPAHPYGRIPIAHIYDVIKELWGFLARSVETQGLMILLRLLSSVGTTQLNHIVQVHLEHT